MINKLLACLGLLALSLVTAAQAAPAGDAEKSCGALAEVDFSTIPDAPTQIGSSAVVLTERYYTTHPEKGYYIGYQGKGDPNKAENFAPASTNRAY